MMRKLLVVSLVLGFANALVVAQTTTASISLSAAEIVAKNIAARGGLQAWRAVQTLSESGKLGAGGDKRQSISVPIPGAKRPAKDQPLPSTRRLDDEAQLPFLLELERPRKVRMELQFKGKTAVQVYDGANGWKLRPYLNRLEVENFTPTELKLASMQTELDGPLVDYAAKGTTVALDGIDTVDNEDNYKLKLTFQDGRSSHVWISAKTFLESKMEVAPRQLDGVEHPVEVYFHDYRNVDGLKIPFVLETRVVPLADHPAAAQFPIERIVIEKVEVNPKLDAAHFSKPAVETAALAKPH